MSPLFSTDWRRQRPTSTWYRSNLNTEADSILYMVVATNSGTYETALHSYTGKPGRSGKWWFQSGGNTEHGSMYIVCRMSHCSSTVNSTCSTVVPTVGFLRVKKGCAYLPVVQLQREGRWGTVTGWHWHVIRIPSSCWRRAAEREAMHLAHFT